MGAHVFTCTRVNKYLTRRSAIVGIQRGGCCTHIKKLIFFSGNPTTAVRFRFRTGVGGGRRSGAASIFAGRTWAGVAGGADDTAT